MIQNQEVLDLAPGLIRAIEMINEKLNTQEKVVVFVAGGSASGKTSQVAKKLAEHFAESCALVSADNYYHGNEFMEECKNRGESINWDHPRAVNLELLSDHVLLLKSDQDVERLSYDFSTGIAGPDKKIHTLTRQM